MILGWLGVGRYVSLIPYPVISGFMSGIGVIIIILQLGPLMGHPAEGGVMPNLWALPTFLANPMTHAAALGVLTLVIVYGTPSVIGKFIPPPLLALIIGTLTAIFLFHNAPVIGAVPQGFPSVIVPTLRFDVLTVIIQGACVIALLCAIDSLLSDHHYFATWTTIGASRRGRGHTQSVGYANILGQSHVSCGGFRHVDTRNRVRNPKRYWKNCSATIIGVDHWDADGHFSVSQRSGDWSGATGVSVGDCADPSI